MNKNNFSFFAFIISSLTFVSAQSTQLGYNLAMGMGQLVDIIESLFGPLLYLLLGGGSGEFLFERILFFGIILCVTYIALSRMGPFKDNKAVVWVVTISVSLLAVRFLPDTEFVTSILLPYSAFGVAITAIIPFLIYFWFVQSFDESPTMRKILWTFYIVVFIAIWSTRYEVLGSISWFYFWSAVAAFLLLLFDGTIRRMMIKGEMEELKASTREEHMVILRKRMEDLLNNEKHYSKSGFKRAVRNLQDSIKRATKI